MTSAAATSAMVAATSAIPAAVLFHLAEGLVKRRKGVFSTFGEGDIEVLDYVEERL